MDIISVEIKDFIKPKPYAYIEFWNPSIEQLLALIPYLKEHRTIAIIWCYGKVEDLEDYTPIFEFDGGRGCDRISVPMWLGDTAKESYSTYAKNREVLLGTEFLYQPVGSI